MSEISVLIVNYRSAALTRAAIESARSATSAELEVIVVDNSESQEEIEALRPANAKIIRAPRNLGYGGAINYGAGHCSAEVIVASNPDVIFRDGCIDKLGSSLDSFAMTGPRIAWDTGGEWLLPPADLATAALKWREVVAGFSRATQRRFDRRRTRARIAFWSAAQPRGVDALSGAVMCFRRELLSRVGPFDERFHLFFEEIDFMRRMRGEGLPIGFVPAANCRHLYSQTSPSNAARGEAYGRSEELYFTKWSPLSWGMAKRIARPLRPLPVHEELSLSHSIRIPSSIAARDALVEVSPLPSFYTSAGHFPASEEVVIPQEVRQSLREDTLFARVISRSTGEVARVIRLRKSE